MTLTMVSQEADCWRCWQCGYSHHCDAYYEAPPHQCEDCGVVFTSLRIAGMYGVDDFIVTLDAYCTLQEAIDLGCCGDKFMGNIKVGQTIQFRVPSKIFSPSSRGWDFIIVTLQSQAEVDQLKALSA